MTLRRLKGGWYEARGRESYTLARRWPAQFDVSASASFPPLRRSRLARQIRQDLWRELQRMRGFSPVVKISFTDDGLMVIAGGRTHATPPNGTAERIEALLRDPARRARWIAWARGPTSW